MTPDSLSPIRGLHHVTAICRDAQRTIDFYTDVLGLRLTKLTVNVDDPYTYHLYLSDDRGTPGSTLTFFVWPDAGDGRAGNGQTMTVGYTVPLASLAYWSERLVRKGVKFEQPFKRFDETVLRFRDPDGLIVEVIAHPQGDERRAWEGGGIPAEHSLRGFHSITLLEDGYELTQKLLTETLDFRKAGVDGTTYRFEVGDGGPGTYIDIRVAPDFLEGRMGIGAIHHIALHTADDEAEVDWRQRVIEAGTNPSPVLDRYYFRSVYFHEPGGTLFELATDGPGFMLDQSYEKLGSGFTLQPWFEPLRGEITASLPPVRIPPFPVQST